MARGTWFITPKDAGNLSANIRDRELGEKLVRYGKLVNLNISEVVVKLCKEVIDSKLEEFERSEYELLNEEAKVDTIMELKRKLKEAGIDA